MDIKTTERTASVQFKNESSRNILALCIGHKYSDVYKDTVLFDQPVQKGAASGWSLTKVHFNTGIATTGKDWWLIILIDEQGKIYYTDPNNFRGVIDFLESMWGLNLKGVQAIASLLSALPTGIGNIGAAIIGGVAGLMGKMVNSESTKGFKQHILRKDDDCTIEVYDKELKFVSPSGTSTTTLSEMTFSDQSYTPRTYDISESNVLENDQQLKRGAYITSPSGLFQLIFQEDSNLVLYTKGGYPMWATATDKKDGTYAIMQADGNLVIYNDQDEAIWGLNNEADHFTFVKNAKLTLQDDGNLVLYKPDGSTAIWATGTNIF